MALKLSGFEDEDQPVIKLKVNKEFAKHYDKSRKSEELMKLKARYGDVRLDGGDGSDTSSETEDEDAEELTPDVEQKWLRTLAALKSDDPRIYDDKTQFFDEEDNKKGKKVTKKGKAKKEKKVTLKDMDRKVITERDGVYSDNSSDSDAPLPRDKGYYEEQREIRNSILQAQQDVSDSEDEASSNQLLTVKVKSAAEKEAEEEEYRKFIKGQQANVDKNVEKDLSGLRDYWNREDISDADKFLKNYILEKKYLVDEEKEGDSSDEGSDQSGPPQVWSDDEEADDNADKFELKYNFRFEEPDPEFIKSYPRTVNTTMRAEKNKRKEKRALVQERKDKEKQKRREELNRLRNLKKKDIEDKLKCIMEKSGADRMPFTGEELDEDFNPDDHDKKMKEMFPDDEMDDEESLVKPTFEYDPEIDDNENWDKYPVAASGVNGVDSLAVYEEELLDPEDPNFVMDADYDPNAATLNDRNFGLDGSSKRNKRKKHRLKKALCKKKPLFNPESKSFEEYLDEYYGLECEDMIGDIKCRFPYREVPANDYGLSVGEILSARDKELNSWSSLKKTVQYRSNDEEHKDIAKFRRKSRDVNKKKRMLPSLFRVENEEEEPSDKEEVTSPAADNTNSDVQPDTPGEQEVSAQKLDTNVSADQHTSSKKTKRKAKFKGKGKQVELPEYEQSSRGMSFKRMEAFGMHSEVKRVKKLRARDKRRN